MCNRTSIVVRLFGLKKFVMFFNNYGRIRAMNINDEGKRTTMGLLRSLKDGDEKPHTINTCYQGNLLCTFGKVGATSVALMLHQYLHFHFNLKTLQ
jgi:hypothetical protein